MSLQAHVEAQDPNLAEMVAGSDQAIVETAADGQVRTWNSAAERMLGFDAFDPTGSNLFDLVPPECREDLAACWDRVRRGEPAEHHVVMRQPADGRAFDAAISASPIHDAHAVTGAFVIIRDIGEAARVASAVAETRAALETALADASEAEMRSRELLADAAHQLRTPIAGISACAETLLRGSCPAEDDSLVVNLMRETARATRLMESLLRMARLDRGEAAAPSACDVGALCYDEADRMHPLCPHLDLVLRVGELPPERPHLDHDTVREILANLLDNARRHARNRVELELDVDEQWVHLRVLDDGPGLSDEHAERAFERFVSLDGKGGSGLGLPIARELARAHGGDLTYQDKAFVARLRRGRPACNDTARADAHGGARPSR